ncbi:MAG: hypothetical protein OEY99_00470 [Aigarchaeota archaeon]|nr:hypothetical protein [Aigarchaeota archaeon]
MIQVAGRQTSRGIEIQVGGKAYAISYPNDVWQNYPGRLREVLLDNLVFAATIHLSLVLKETEVLYNTNRPLFQPHFFQNMIMDFPSCADVDHVSTSDIVRRFMNLNVRFSDDRVRLPRYSGTSSPDSSVISLSFGKDSLLSYAVCREIGLNPHVAYVVEPSMKYEEKHKTALARRFHREFGVKLDKIVHSAGLLRDGVHLGVGKTELGWGLQSTEYALILLPVAHSYAARYIVFGNEQSCAAYYADQEGYICYPAYDQSHVWTLHVDSMTRLMSKGQVRTMSVIEPLMDIAVMGVLHHRYPDVGKYEMSCFTETESGRDRRWCLSCPICAKMYLLMRALGIHPRRVGLSKNMLTAKNRGFFSLFGGKNVATYALTRLGRDEQLLAFYLAHRNGDRSELVREFSRRFLGEAREREEELRRLFFGIHRPITMPAEIESRVLSIYREELTRLQEEAIP